MDESQGLKKPRILVADDDNEFLKALAIILKASGFEVTTVTSGDHAVLAHEVSLVAKKPFDILVLDLRMPGASGWEVLRHVRETTPPADRPPRVLLMTGFTVALDLDRVRAEGADGILIKPFVLTALVKEIRRVLSIPPGEPSILGAGLLPTPARKSVRTVRRPA